MQSQVVKKKIGKLLILVLCSCIIGVLSSVVIAGGRYMLGGDKSEVTQIEDSDINIRGEITKNGDIYTISGNGGEIIINFPTEVYINKLQFQYETAESQDNLAQVKIYTKNVYGEEEIENLSDGFFSETHRSVINIGNDVSKISVEIADVNTELKIGNFIIDNAFKCNPIIAALVSICVFVFAFLFIFREENARFPAVATFLCILVVGVGMIVFQPPYCTSWDEQIHFSNSYNMAVVPRDQGTPNVVRYLRDNAPWLNQHQVCSTIEERLDLIEVMNQKGEEYGQPVELYELQMSSVGYIFQAAFITVGRFLQLPFYLVWILGKFSNVLLYAFGMSVAVAITPIGKRLLSVISLIPTFVFISASYTYDVTVTVFITIAICIWIREVVYIDQPFTTKWRLAYFICMIIGCMPKAVYAPLLLCVLLLPKSKFGTLKEQWHFRIGVVLCGILLLSTFVLPTLLSSSGVQGDMRGGGDVSVSGQMQYVLGQPIAYAQVLFENVFGTFTHMVAGDWLSSFAYLGGFLHRGLCFALLVGVGLTDTYAISTRKEELSCRNKTISLISVCLTIILIWTALYLSFTEVGETVVAGVQGRYYFPFFFLLYLCFRSNKIKNKFPLPKYQTLVMVMANGVLLYSVYSVIFTKSCL